MPQLDIFSWFNQVITTTCVMFVFYMLLILLFLPTTTAIVKGRTKLNQLRLVTLQIISLQTIAYMSDIKQTLINLLTNNFIPVYNYYFPVNNNQLNLNILRTCYNVNRLHLEKLLLNYALVNLLSNATNIITSNNQSNNVVITEENLTAIKKVIMGVKSLKMLNFTKMRRFKKYWYNPISFTKNYITQEKLIYQQPNFFPVYTKKKHYFYLIMLNSIVENISTRQDMKAFLQRFYGYGLARSLKIALMFGYGKGTYSFDTLHNGHRRVMVQMVEKNKYLLGYPLRDLRKRNITRLRKVNCYRGIRHALYLPVRGQRTHTNAHMARYVLSGTFDYVPQKPGTKKIKSLSKYTRRKPHIAAASELRYSRLLQKSYNEFKKHNRALFKQLEKKNKLGAFSRIHKEKLKADKLKAKAKKKKLKIK